MVYFEEDDSNATILQVLARVMARRLLKCWNTEILNANSE